MGTKHPEIFAALAAPFEPEQVMQRSENGRTMKYITARTARNRLDDILGPENWSDEPIPYMDGTGSFLCKITITLPDGTKVTKSGVGGGKARGNKQGPSEPKDSESDAFKRASEKFGIARYLYRDGVPKFVQEAVGTEETRPQKGGGGGYAQSHRQPADEGRRQVNETFSTAQQRRPESKWGGARPDQDHAPAGGPSRSYDGSPPRSGKALFAWTKDQEQRHQVGLLKYLNEFMKYQEMPSRMVDLDGEQVTIVYEEAMRKLGNEDDRGDAYEDALSN